METSLLDQGLELMIYGIATVALFLSLLVVATAAMSAVVNRLFPVTESPKTTSPHEDRDEVVAIISAALQQHRRRR
ncbi:MAG: OadG family protein [Pseudomonadota bacterium]